MSVSPVNDEEPITVYWLVENICWLKYSVPFRSMSYRLQVVIGNCCSRGERNLNWDDNSPIQKNKLSPRVRKCAVRLIQEHRGEYPSLWTEVELIAHKIGCDPATLLEWKKRSQIDNGNLLF